MYKDNGKLDVELLAEVGSIAHRIRNLDEKLALDQTKSACFKYPYPKPLPVSTTAPTPSIIVDCEQTSPKRKNSTHSIHIAQDIGDKLDDLATAEPSTAQTSDGDSRNNSSKSTSSATGCGGRRYSNKHIEDIILEFYEKHLIYHQKLEKDRIAAQIDTQDIRSKIYRLTSSNTHTMNESSSVVASNTDNTTTSIAAASESIADDAGKLFYGVVLCCRMMCKHIAGRYDCTTCGKMSEPCNALRLTNESSRLPANARNTNKRQRRRLPSQRSPPRNR